GGGGGRQEEEAGAPQAAPQAGSDRRAAQDGRGARARPGGIERSRRRRRLSTPDARVPVDHRPPPFEPQRREGGVFMRRRRSDERERDSGQAGAALRARTGAGMMDCKKALEETAGDLEKAV